MPKTANPLNEMTESISYDSSADPRPSESYLETSLPGFKQALNARRAVRVFDESPIPEDAMRDCLHDATLAPSSSNLQAYEFYWVRDSGKKAAVADACLGQPAATTAGDLIVVVARSDLWRSHRDKLLKIMTHNGTMSLPKPLDDYYKKTVPMVMRNDPVGINNLVRRLYIAIRGRRAPVMRTPVNRGDHRIYGHIQSSLAAQTLMLSLAAHGYDSCPMGAFDNVRIRRLLRLPRYAEVSMVIAAGRGLAEGIYGPRVRFPDEELIKEV